MRRCTCVFVLDATQCVTAEVDTSQWNCFFFFFFFGEIELNSWRISPFCFPVLLLKLLGLETSYWCESEDLDVIQHKWLFLNTWAYFFWYYLTWEEPPINAVPWHGIVCVTVHHWTHLVALKHWQTKGKEVGSKFLKRTSVLLSNRGFAVVTAQCGDDQGLS